ncbi:acetyl-CoA carboxylase biotin carboxyl carrier protein [Ferrovibrio sp.]|uniref:acetyl-CoA carboxylase biotin carboxyl carrier protein n=1 Tax=Ferrovibrio sp. TaxID=1917215 RepID=UPI002ECFFCB5
MASAPQDKNGKSRSSRVDQQMIRDLADLLNETGLTEIEWSEGPLKVRVTKGGAAGAPVYAAPASVAAAPAVPAAAASAGASEADLASHPGAVKSPMVGTIYVAPEPGAAPFVKVGDTVNAGQTLLIVEAMKTMNPITAPKGGRIAQILIENQQPVEFGQVLLIIE